jgi:hypothetical protein
MKFDNLNTWLTEPCEGGPFLKELGYTYFYGRPEAHFYYEKGISEFDRIFNSENYIKAGYVCTMLANVGEMCIFCAKFKGEDISDFGVARINRKNILSFDVLESDNLLVVKEDDSKHKAKSKLKTVGKIAFAGGGLIGGAIADAIVSTEGKSVNANTELVNGAKFILNYKDKDGIEKSIVLYCSERNHHLVQLFLNTYYKSELPEQAKNPAKTSNNNCFIATACYRDLYSPEVILLRKFRDEILNKHFFGRIFIKFYYATSPYVYHQLLDRPKISNRLKVALDRLVQLIRFFKF